MATPSSSSSSSSFKLVGHTSDINSIAGHPFLPMLASGSDDTTVRIWDLETRRCVRTLRGHTDWVYAVALDPTGRRVASGSSDDTVKLWDLDSAESCPVHTLCDRGLGTIVTVAWNPSSTLVASGSTDRCVCVWDAASGILLHTLEGHLDWIRAIASHPTDDLFASASDDATVRVWRWSTGESVHTLEGHKGWVTSLAASAFFVVSGSRDKTVRVWSWASGLCVRVIDGFEEPLYVHSLAWRDSTLVASAPDGNLRVWDTSSSDEDPSKWSSMSSLPFKTQSQSGAAMVEGGTRVTFVASDDSKAIAVWDFEHD